MGTTRDGNNIMQDLWFLFFLPIIYLYIFLFVIFSFIHKHPLLWFQLLPWYESFKSSMCLALRIIFSFLTAHRDMLFLEDNHLNYSDMFMSKNETMKLPNKPTVLQRKTHPPLGVNLACFPAFFLVIQCLFQNAPHIYHFPFTHTLATLLWT